MFAEPTIDDFKNWIDWHLRRAADGAERGIGSTIVKMNAVGRYRSGATVEAVFTEAKAVLELGIDAALGELKKAIRADRLDKVTMRQETEAQLRVFLARVKTATRHDKLREFAGDRIVQPRLQACNELLDFKLRQFDVGFFDPDEPEARPPVKNQINIDTMVGSAIQQGTTGSIQSVQVVLQGDLIRVALDKFERALDGSEIDRADRASIAADLATIRAQLSKPQLSTTLLQEAGRSARNVVEGILGGVLTPATLAAASALWAVLGLG